MLDTATKEEKEKWAKEGVTTAYYDRTRGSIEGSFTIQTVWQGRIVLAFSRLPARSGQRREAEKSWTFGSPIPFSTEIMPRKFKIWLKGQLQFGQWAIGKGIGEFWRISTESDKVTILSANGLFKKEAVGVHPENIFNGSMACIVLVNETLQQKQRILEARAWAQTVARWHESIELVVL